MQSTNCRDLYTIPRGSQANYFQNSAYFAIPKTMNDPVWYVVARQQITSSLNLKTLT